MNNPTHRVTKIAARTAACTALTAVALIAAATGVNASVAAAAPASASNGPAVVKVNTHQTGVPDTTNIAGSNTKDSPNGPIWAYDNLERKITATPTGNGTWTVKVASQGSYAAIADPETGGPASSTSGPVSGEVNYTVQADTQPSGARIKSQSPLSLHSSDLVQALFDNDPQTTIETSSYKFDYKLAGKDYTQKG